MPNWHRLHRSGHRPPSFAAGRGYLLLEVLISLLVFSIGVLGIIGLAASAIQNETDAKNRIDASFLVNELVGKMWTEHLLPAADLATRYAGGSGTDGAGYTAWLNDIINNNKLPGVTATTNVPVVTVTVDSGTDTVTNSTTTSLVSITLRWQAPTGPAHQYTVVTEIK